MSINTKAPTLTEWLEQKKAEGQTVTEHTGRADIELSRRTVNLAKALRSFSAKKETNGN